jgi:hypothetical protein
MAEWGGTLREGAERLLVRYKLPCDRPEALQSSVRPNMIMGRQMPDFVEAELQNKLAAVLLLKGLEPQFGAAVLPRLGIGKVYCGKGRQRRDQVLVER